MVSQCYYVKNCRITEELDFIDQTWGSSFKNVFLIELKTMLEYLLCSKDGAYFSLVFNLPMQMYRKNTLLSIFSSSTEGTYI